MTSLVHMTVTTDLINPVSYVDAMLAVVGEGLPVVVAKVDHIGDTGAKVERIIYESNSATDPHRLQPVLLCKAVAFTDFRRPDHFVFGY